MVLYAKDNKVCIKMPNLREIFNGTAKVVFREILNAIVFFKLRDQTPLYRAVLCGNEKKVKRLLSRGSDPNTVGVNGATPLNIAAGMGDIGIIKALLDGGADPDRTHPPFLTPSITYAAITGQSEAVAVLLAAGADPHQKDNSGATALENVKRSTSLSKDIQQKIIMQLQKAMLEVPARSKGHSTCIPEPQ